MEFFLSVAKRHHRTLEKKDVIRFLFKSVSRFEEKASIDFGIDILGNVPLSRTETSVVQRGMIESLNK